MFARASYNYDWSIVWAHLGPLGRGLLVTIELALGGMAVALVLGLVVVAARMSRSPILSRLARAYIWFMRGVPLFVFLFWIYYGLARTADIIFGAFAAGVVALGLTGSGYMAEIYRGGLQSVDPGQREAGLAIGLSRVTTFHRVILPQAIRIILGPTVNLFVGLLKGATIIGVLGVADMLYFAQIQSLKTFKPFELYTAAGLILVAVTIAVAGFAALIDRRLGRGANRG
jgi:His/Glu/Gln/Arg/opine family amino acid ABC transporter permease subunit